MSPPQRISIERLIVRKQKRGAPGCAVVNVIAVRPAIQKNYKPAAVIQASPTGGRQDADDAAVHVSKVIEIRNDRVIKKMPAQAAIVGRGRLHTTGLRLE